jgi:hypothetical protein
MPLVDVFSHLNHSVVEPKSSKPFGATFVHIGFNLNPHSVLHRPLTVKMPDALECAPLVQNRPGNSSEVLASEQVITIAYKPDNPHARDLPIWSVPPSF